MRTLFVIGTLLFWLACAVFWWAGRSAPVDVQAVAGRWAVGLEQSGA